MTTMKRPHTAASGRQALGISKNLQDDYRQKLAACLSNSHQDYVEQVLNSIEALEKNPHRNLICQNALTIGNCHWTLLLPYFATAAHLTEKITKEWSAIAINLACRNIEVGKKFLELTPLSADVFEPADTLRWGSGALAILKKNRRTAKAAAAYLKEALSPKCPFPLFRWKFLLEQAERIAIVSAVAAESFVRFGTHICQGLDDDNILQWVTEGLSDGLSTQQLARYFDGTISLAFEKRNAIKSREILKDRINLLSLICEANLGKPVRIQSNAALSDVDGFSGGAGTDGCIIYLPDMASDFGLYKLMALHQSMLIDTEAWKDEFENAFIDDTRIHLDADKRLLERLPGLRQDMDRLMEGGLPTAYPVEVGPSFKAAAWWGDLLPDLMRQTRTTIEEIQEKACEYTDCSPDAVEGFLAGMMARGQRTADGLWEKLRLMFNTSDFGCPEPENLPDDVVTYRYPEWDKEISGYKKDWCLVRERAASDASNSFVRDVRSRLHGIVSLVRKQFMRFKPEQFRRFRAQSFGDNLDIDALIQSVVDKRTGACLSENVYIRRDKMVRDVAVLFLVDLSESTEEKVDGRRVIDIHKEAVVLMSEALESLNDTYGLYGFNSDGRFRVNIYTIKEFNESAGEQIEHRIGNLSPGGLTRLGAAIRHASAKLAAVRSRTKLMIILTDGRPYDLDYGDMSYAIGDTKKAIQEARKLKIHPFIITSDPEGARYLKQISPLTQSIILPRVELLPYMLPRIYKRLTI